MQKKIVTLEGKFPWQIALDFVNAEKERKALEEQANRDRQAAERQAEADRQAAIRQAEAERQALERIEIAKAQAEKEKAILYQKQSEEAKARNIIQSQALTVLEQKRQELTLRQLLAEKERLLEKEQKLIDAKKILNQPVSIEEEEFLEGLKMKIKSMRTGLKTKLPKASPLKSLKLTPFGVVPKSTFAKAHQPKTKKGKKQKRAQEKGVAKGVGVVGLGIGAVFGAPLLASGIASLGSGLLSSSGGVLSALKGGGALSSILGQSNIMSAGTIDSGSEWGGQSMMETFQNPSIQNVDEESNYIDSFEESDLLGQSRQTKKKPAKKVVIKKKDKKTGQVIQKKTVSRPIPVKKAIQRPIGKKVLNQSFQPYGNPSQTTNFPVRSVSYNQPPELEFDQSEIMEEEYRDTSREVPFIEEYDYNPFEEEMETDNFMEEEMEI
jgi:hypothetical protein